MPDVVTDTSTLKVVLLEEGNREQTINIPAPLSNMNLTKIKNAFASGISNNLIIGPYGSYIVAVARATKEDKLTQKYESDGIYYTVEPLKLTSVITKASTNGEGESENIIGTFKVIGAIPDSYSLSSSTLPTLTTGETKLFLDFSLVQEKIDNQLIVTVKIMANRTNDIMFNMQNTTSYVYFNDLDNGRYIRIAVNYTVQIPA